MERTFEVQVKNGTIIVMEGPDIIAAGSPASVAKELKTVFEAMKKSV
jgi:hypothetical protein